jgi:hypothetical protein
MFIMTQTLEKAWNSVLNLSEDRQDLIAYMILEELQDEKLWDKSFENSKGKLSLIAEKVRNDIRARRNLETKFNNLN